MENCLLQQKYKVNNLKIKKIDLCLIFICFLVCFLNLNVGLLCLLAFICLGSMLQKNYDFFEPLNYFSCWYFYYYGLGYICYLIRAEVGMTQKFDNEIILEGQILSILVILFLKILLKLFPAKKYLYIQNNNAFFARNDSIFLISVIVLNFLLSFYYWIKIGGIPILIKGYHDSLKASLGIGLGWIEYVQSFLGILNTVLVMVTINRKNKDRYILYLFVFFNMMLLPILNDSRGSAVFGLLDFLMLYDWNKRKISVKKIFFVGFIMACLATLWGVVRSGGNFLTSGFVFLAEIGVEYDGYLNVIKMFPREINYTLGTTFIPCFTLLFPRALMPNKNMFMTGGEFYKNMMHMDYIRVGVRFTLAGEFYMNFGRIASVVLTVIVFFTLIRASLIMYRNRENYKYQYFALFFLSTAKGFMAGDAATAFSINFYNLFFVSLVLFFLYSWKPRPRKIMIQNHRQ